MATITCVTTRYLPNIRHLARLHEADTVVLLDLAPLPDRNATSFVNRNRVWNAELEREVWLTVPIVRGREQMMRDVRIAACERAWPRSHAGSISAALPMHKSVAPGFIEQLLSFLFKQNDYLIQMNADINAFLLSYLGKPRQIISESSIIGHHRKSHRLDICKTLGANCYIAGEVEWNAMDASGELHDFKDSGLDVVKSGSVMEAGLSSRMVRDLSCVDAICRYGHDCVSEVLSTMILSSR